VTRAVRVQIGNRSPPLACCELTPSPAVAGSGTRVTGERNRATGENEGVWNPALPNSLESVQIVYKVAERCNINCTYCYYFNMGDNTPLERPARASLATTERIGTWLAQGCETLSIPRVHIAFHGGEPFLIGMKRFDEMCAILRDRVLPIADIEFSVQTNGTIFNEEWLAVMRENQVSIGVSIDGDRNAHDRYRLDRHGRSTFEKTEATIKALVQSAEGDPTLLPTTISVLDHRVDYVEAYSYLRSLGVETMSFLLPDRNADDVEFRTSGLAAQYGHRLMEIFESWLREDNPMIRVRFIDETLRHFKIGLEPGPVTRRRKDVQVLIARSDGTIAVDDSYIPALTWYSAAPVYSVDEASLPQVLADPIYALIEKEIRTLPARCQACRWQVMCRGGDLENRFSERNGFDNPSIYCDAYMHFYGEVCELLERNGYPRDEIERRFPRLTEAV